MKPASRVALSDPGEQGLTGLLRVAAVQQGVGLPVQQHHMVGATPYPFARSVRSIVDWRRAAWEVVTVE
ncbi:MAG: hypothetical protein ACRDSL_18825 [Pseudonocardiaceae bacterium]